MKPVFDKPWHIIAAKVPGKEESIAGFSNKIEIWRGKEKLGTAYIRLPNELFTFMRDIVKAEDLSLYYLYADVDAESKRCYIGIAKEAGSGVPDIDLWYYTPSNMPAWLRDSVDGRMF